MPGMVNVLGMILSVSRCNVSAETAIFCWRRFERSWAGACALAARVSSRMATSRDMLRKTLKSREFILKIVKFGLLLHEQPLCWLFHEKESNLKAQIMKKHTFFFLFALFFGLQAIAQSIAPSSGYRLKGKNRQAVFSASLPVGVFGDSHLPGIGLAYSWSHNRFGDSVNVRKIIGFTAQAGLDYYLGKKVTTAGYAFRYNNYFYVHVMPGIICNPSPKTNISLLAGPALGMYKESSSLGFEVSLSGAYHFNHRMSLGPVALYRKHAEVDALWAAGARLSYAF